MSSRAVNPELLKMLMDFNRLAENWTIQRYAPSQRTGIGGDARKWGGRARRLLHAIYLIAFWCLLRFDEVLKIQFHDLEVISPSCIKLTLPFRKTHQFGGMPLSCQNGDNDDVYLQISSPFIFTSLRNPNPIYVLCEHWRSGSMFMVGHRDICSERSWLVIVWMP